MCPQGSPDIPTTGSPAWSPLEEIGCDYQIAQAGADHTTSTLTDVADDHPAPRIVGQAVIEQLDVHRPLPQLQGAHG